MGVLIRLKSLAMSLPHKEASFSRQGFPGMGSPSREHLETILNAFIDGYNLAVVEPDTKELARRLDAVNKYLVDVKQQFEGNEHLASLGKLVLWSGAQDIVFSASV